MRPDLLSSGPPQLIPIPSGGRGDCVRQKRMSSASRASISSGGKEAVGCGLHLYRIWTRPSVTSPRQAAHLVPPMSTPIAYMVLPPLSRMQKTAPAPAEAAPC
ncbi:hypothetical protein [Clostridium sp. D33t1_170424_F3]|uniref:hypothetical protein n=1 Tax=Clostridium sp. D33t1_170424_F3 TaxID=2787099 RepID=UPI002570BCC1|nr:hypothetical protein [Clostridium sp. D33t1_170424_F3]